MNTPMPSVWNLLLKRKEPSWNFKIEKVFEYTKSPYELYFKDLSGIKEAILGMNIFLNSEIQIIESNQERWKMRPYKVYRMRPALSEEDKVRVENYLNTVLGGN